MTEAVNPDWSARAQPLMDALHMAVPRVAITFEEGPPDGVERFGRTAPEPAADGRTGAVPAGCAFWIHATERTFTTVPEDHGNCSVGSYTHGLLTEDEVLAGGDVAVLLRSGWITPEDAGRIPRVPDRPSHITYGPLAEVSGTPQVILMRVNGRQLMEISDALPDLSIEGKPQCHIVAMAHSGRPAASVGCALSRVRTGMAPTEMTAALPAGRIDEIIERLRATDEINDDVSRYAAGDARRFGQA